MTQFLLEIGLEEIPARFLRRLSEQLVTRMAEFLEEERLTYDAIIPFATPRRLALRVEGLATQQADIEENVKGPSLKIARNEAGEWTKAALGFVKGQGATVDQIVIEQVNGEDYIFVRKFEEGQPSAKVLTKIDRILKQMVFPVSMTWNNIETPYIRPIHWLVSLLEDRVIPVEFVGVISGRVSRGHRFLGSDHHTVTLNHARDYEHALSSEFVMVDFAKRQQVIREQLTTLAKDNQWNIPIDENLLEEVTSIVEWPTAFYGDFEAKYLEVPHNVLITAMRDHQRYFYALDVQSQELLPYFISVRNGNEEHLENVVKGNKKVLRARLEDALFFYQEDLKRELAFYVEKLERVNEHFKLGTLADKQRRVAQMIEKLQRVLALDEAEVTTALRAAEIYKFDLMTQVVGEFDELQGEMGAIYARHFGESEQVAEAIRTQYLPSTSGGELPQTVAGSLLALADKFDTLLQYFNVGIIPTGSNDPYALRRQAMGIIEIILANNWHLDLKQTIPQLVEAFGLEAKVNAELVDFMYARMQQQLARHEVEHDITQAVMSANCFVPTDVLTVAELWQTYKQEQPIAYRQLVEALTRVVNLGVKVEHQVTLSVELAQTDSEREFITQVKDLLEEHSIEVLHERFTSLVAIIERYFEENKVHADDETIKQHRLATLRALTNKIVSLGDPRQLISKF